MPRQPAIEAQGLHKAFGDVRAVDGVDLRVEPGTILGLLGPNGAGKTTTVRILTTLLKPDGGTARLAGQYAAVDENLTGEENLVMVGRLYHLGGATSKQRAAELLETFDLVDAA